MAATAGNLTVTVVPLPTSLSIVKRAAMQLDQRSRDGEAEARPALGLGELVFDLLEGPAELFDVLGRNADAGIGDCDDGMFAIERSRERDAPAFRRELHAHWR